MPTPEDRHPNKTADKNAFIPPVLDPTMAAKKRLHKPYAEKLAGITTRPAAPVTAPVTAPVIEKHAPAPPVSAPTAAPTAAPVPSPVIEKRVQAAAPQTPAPAVPKAAPAPPVQAKAAPKPAPPKPAPSAQPAPAVQKAAPAPPVQAKAVPKPAPTAQQEPAAPAAPAKKHKSYTHKAHIPKHARHAKDPDLVIRTRTRGGGLGALITVVLGLGVTAIAFGYFPQLGVFWDHSNQSIQSHNDEVVNWIMSTVTTAGPFVFGALVVFLLYRIVVRIASPRETD